MYLDDEDRRQLLDDDDHIIVEEIDGMEQLRFFEKVAWPKGYQIY